MAQDDVSELQKKGRRVLNNPVQMVPKRKSLGSPGRRCEVVIAAPPQKKWREFSRNREAPKSFRQAEKENHSQSHWPAQK